MVVVVDADLIPEEGFRISIVLPDGGFGFVAAVGDVGDRGGVADRVDVGHADVRRGFEREIEAQVAAARPVLVDLNDEDIFSRDESGRREVVGGVICLTGGVLVIVIRAKGNGCGDAVFVSERCWAAGPGGVVVGSGTPLGGL